MSKKDKKKKKLKIPPQRYTHRTLIHIAKTQSTLPPEFYRNLTKEHDSAKAKRRFKEEIERENKRKGKKTKTKKKPAPEKTEPVETPEPTDDESILAQLEAYTSEIDSKSMSSGAAMEQAVKLAANLESDSMRLQVHRSLKDHFGMSEPQFKSLVRAANDYEATEDSVDIVQEAVTRFLQDHKCLCTLGNFYLWNEKRKIYNYVPRTTIEAKLAKYIKQLALEQPNSIAIDDLTNKAQKRLGNEVNGELIFNDLLTLPEYSDLTDIARSLSVLTTDIFTNVENIDVSSQRYVSNQRNRVVIIDAKEMTASDIADPYTDLPDSVEELLMLDIDRDLSSRYVHVEKEKEHRYFRDETKVPYISDSKLIDAIKSGKCSNLVRFLHNIVKGYERRSDRVAFITSYLDMLAYVSQPIKLHPSFFYLYGNGNNGKSFGFVMLQSMLANNRYSNNSLNFISENPRFGKSMLSDKYLVVDNELEAFDSKMVGLIKEISEGNKTVSAEVKGQSEFLTYIQKYSMALLSNKCVRIYDASEGIQRRMRAYNLRADISRHFTRDDHGSPLLRYELKYLQAILRLRTPRLIVTGVTQTHLHHKEFRKITGSDPVSAILRKHLGKHKGTLTPISEIRKSIATNYMEELLEDSKKLNTTNLARRIEELGFNINERMEVVNVRWK